MPTLRDPRVEAESAVEKIGGSQQTRRYLMIGLLVTALIRVAVFPFAENFYGDPVMRLRALSEWLEHPFFLRSFLGARQFGPLHLYLLAAMKLLTGEERIGPRLLSLIFGTLSAWPIFALSARRFGAQAALWSTLAFAVYGLHIQASTTAVSEAVFLFFVLSGLSLLDHAADGERLHLLLAGLSMACACAVRYDGWLYAPLSVGWLWTPSRRGVVSLKAVAGYLAIVLAVPAFLMWGNWVDVGDPLYLIHYIDRDHVMNAQRASAHMGRSLYAAYCLAFWPANLLLEMTPLVFVACVGGIVAALRARQARDLFFIAAIPAAYLSLKGALLLQFHPLARFTLPTAVLLMPYVGHGLRLGTDQLSFAMRRVVLAATAATAVAIPTFLAARTMGSGDVWADTMRPVSPVSNLPPDLRRTAAWLRANARSRKTVLGTNWLYEELPIGFYAGLSEGQLWNLRFGPLPQQFGKPDLIVVPKECEQLGTGGAFAKDDLGLSAYGLRYDKLLDIGQVTVFGARIPAG
jgi:4-amino-4-deoxy-L-arabinose transferase-like glycosyltransferase